MSNPILKLIVLGGGASILIAIVVSSIFTSFLQEKKIPAGPTVGTTGQTITNPDVNTDLKWQVPAAIETRLREFLADRCEEFCEIESGSSVAFYSFKVDSYGFHCSCLKEERSNEIDRGSR